MKHEAQTRPRPLPRLAALIAVTSLAATSGSSCMKKGQTDVEVGEKGPPLAPQRAPEDPPDPEVAYDSPPVLIRGARILTGAGQLFEHGHISMRDGKIHSVGDGPGEAWSETEIIDGTGLVVTPGLIDIHSHIGVDGLPRTDAHDDINEYTNPVTPNIWAEHAFWPGDPAIWRALVSGITTIQTLPGSTNLFGGRTFVAKLKPAQSARDMRFPGAKQGLKMACGENPKRVFGDKGGPMTRMGNVAGYRETFQKGLEYRNKLRAFERDRSHWQKRVDAADEDEKKLAEIGDPPEAPPRDFGLETIARVLDGEILVNMHCYQADEMSIMLDMAKEFGFQIKSFHHATDAYKIRHRLAEEKVTAVVWADWWGFKMEAFDFVPQNAALLEEAGVNTTFHSDSPMMIRHLNHEVAKAVANGARIGVTGIDENTALAWITLNPAKALEIDDKVGSLEKGKMADVVAWNMNPFSVYAHPELVFIDGVKLFDRGAQDVPIYDFEVGLREPGLADGRDFREGAAIPQVAELPLEAPLANPAASTQAPGSDSFAVKNVTIEVGDGETVDTGTAVVVDGVIRAVGSRVPIPGGVPVIDGAGKVLSPGLVLTGGALGLYDVSLERRTVDFRYEGNPVSPGFRAADGFNPSSFWIPVTREEGITTAISAPSGELIYGTALMFDLALASDEGFDSGSLPEIDPAVAMFGGVSGAAAASQGESRGGVWLRLREIFDDARWFDRNRRAYDRGQSRELSLSPTHLEALIPLLEGKLPLVLEAHRASDIRAALRFREEVNDAGGKLRLIISGGAEAWLVAGELAAAKVPVTLVPSYQLPLSFDMLNARDDLAAYLASNGVPLIISGWGQALRQEAGIAVSYGLDHAAAIEAMTLAPAESFGRGDEIGSVAKGKRANLVLWSGDPLENTTVAERLWIDGVEIDLATRQTQLAERYRKPREPRGKK